MYAYKEEIQVTRDIPNPFTSKLQEIQKQFIKKRKKKSNSPKLSRNPYWQFTHLEKWCNFSQLFIFLFAMHVVINLLCSSSNRSEICEIFLRHPKHDLLRGVNQHVATRAFTAH